MACWQTCDVEEYDEEVINLFAPDISNYKVSTCCHAGIITKDEEEIEEAALDIEENCYTFEEALGKYGNIAFFIAENMVFIPEYEEDK